MSEIDRLARLGKAMIGRAGDWLNDVERRSAEDEIDQYVPPPRQVSTQGGSAQPGEKKVTISPSEERTWAQRKLGVEENATFDDIERRFKELSKKCDSSIRRLTKLIKNDPQDASVEDSKIVVQQMKHLRDQLAKAYEVLTKDAHLTFRRMKTLEVDAHDDSAEAKGSKAEGGISKRFSNLDLD
jgi:hypothetical protein